MVGYKLSKNDWVTPFFVIFRSVREILLVTVFLEHPVKGGTKTETGLFTLFDPRVGEICGENSDHLVNS